MGELLNSLQKSVDKAFGFEKTDPKPKAEPVCEKFTAADVQKMSYQQLFTETVSQTSFGTKACLQLVNNEMEKRGYKSGR